MSYILDALRKSEQERRPGSALGMARPDPGPAILPRRRIGWYALPIAGVLVLIVGAYLLVLRPMDETPTTVATVEATSMTAPSVPAPSSAPKALDTPAPASNVASVAPQAKSPATRPVRDLVEQTRVAPKPAPRAAAPVRASIPTPIPAATSARIADVRLLRVMPPDFQRSLPEMVVNIHVYAAAAAERILYINNRQYHAGDKVRDDVIVEEIVEDGAVLSFRGTRFKLPRPS